MARKSSIDKLDPRLREVLDRLVRDNRCTIDQIAVHLEQLAGEDAPSRSAVGRYVKNAKQQMEQFRQAQEIAKVWVGKLEDEPQGDVAMLLSQMLRTLAFQQLASMGEAGGNVSSKELAMLAGAIRDVANADKTAADRALRLRKEIATQAAAVAEKTLTGQGMSRESIDTIKREILGIA